MPIAAIRTRESTKELQLTKFEATLQVRPDCARFVPTFKQDTQRPNFPIAPVRPITIA